MAYLFSKIRTIAIFLVMFSILLFPTSNSFVNAENIPEIETDNVGLDILNIARSRTYLGVWPSDVTDIYVYADTINCPSSLGNSTFLTAVQNSMNRWNNIRSSSGNIILTYHLTDDPDEAGFPMSRNEILWSDSLEVGVLGYAGIVRDSYNDQHIHYFKLKLNRNVLWYNGSASNRFDIQTVLTHELGHDLGVPHCHEKGPIMEEEICESDTCNSNVMNPYTDPGEIRRTLTFDDILTYRMLYY